MVCCYGVFMYGLRVSGPKLFVLMVFYGFGFVFFWVLVGSGLLYIACRFLVVAHGYVQILRVSAGFQWFNGFEGSLWF